jgi:predicted DNA-binding transcriptional regulator YafY
MMDRTEPFDRADLVDAFPDDYAGSPAAVEKKLNRDQEALRRLGVALRHAEDERERYLVDRTALHLAPLKFEDAEAAVVWMAGRAALRAGEHPLRDDLDTALRKLTVGARGLPAVSPAPEPLAPPPAGLQLSERLRLLADAVQRRRRIHLVYRGGAEGSETVRDVDVYGYGLRRGEWFFLGHCHLRGEPRLFLVRRVVALEDTAQPADHACSIPKGNKGGDYTVPPGFDLEAWRLQEPWDYLAHPPVEAVVRLRGGLARAARTLLPDATLTLAADGAREARLTVRNLEGLVRQVLAWGEEAELLAPPEGRAQARTMLDALAGALAREVAP